VPESTNNSAIRYAIHELKLKSDLLIRGRVITLVKDAIPSYPQLYLTSVEITYNFREVGQEIEAGFTHAMSPVDNSQIAMLPNSFSVYASPLQMGPPITITMTVPAPFDKRLSPPPADHPEAMFIMRASKGMRVTVVFNIRSVGIAMINKAMPEGFYETLTVEDSNPRGSSNL